MRLSSEILSMTAVIHLETESWGEGMRRLMVDERVARVVALGNGVRYTGSGIQEYLESTCA